MIMNKKNYGGFFGLELPFAKSKNSVLSAWGVNHSNSILLHNARSALNFLLKFKDIKKIFLPAYICVELYDSINPSTFIELYPISDYNLSPDIDYLSKKINPGDAVLVVNYFGKLQSHEFIRFVNKNQDIIWIEDRAQTLWQSGLSWSDWVIYSPRKLLGVPDGGILINQKGGEDISSFCANLNQNMDLSYMLPSLARFENFTPKLRYKYYSEVEKRMAALDYQMSYMSKLILHSTDHFPLVERRIRNFHALYKNFSNYALMESAGDFAPFGFPVLLPNAIECVEELRKRGIYAARHWIKIPNKFEAGEFEKKLSSECVTIPCDHRFSNEDIEIISSKLEEVLS